jgi:hypothetical protein
MTGEKLTASMNVPLTPSLRAEIDRLAAAEALKPATTARRLILAGLAAQKSMQSEVRHD